jgi:hypothetical protein
MKFRKKKQEKKPKSTLLTRKTRDKGNKTEITP